MAVKKRCGFCLRVVRADGTCANKSCPRYVPDKTEEPIEEAQEETPATEPTQDETTQEEPAKDK